MLEKTTTVMSLSTKTRVFPYNAIAFDCDSRNPEDEVRSHSFFLDKSVWEDMDRPHDITVTIEKGDKLNV